MRINMGRRWRTIVVFVVGAVAGATLLAPLMAPDGRATAVTIYTRSVSCAGSSFYPTDMDTAYDMSGTLRRRPAAGGSGSFRCDPGLPHGAVVTKVRFTLFDGSLGGNVGPCSLKRVGLLAATGGTEEVLASVPATGFNPGLVRPEDTSISLATVDASKYGYWLECSIGGGDYILGIVGADVTFTITAAKG